jgi:putative nucleotidyltransferase with HDIG domain
MREYQDEAPVGGKGIEKQQTEEKLFGERKIAPEVKNILEKEPVILELLKEMREYDWVTFDHLMKVGELSVAISKELELSSSESDLLLGSALVHDIGKLKISKEILQKKGKYSDEERVVMQSHADIGAEMLRDLGEYQKAEMTQRHHEQKRSRRYQVNGRKNVPMLKEKKGKHASRRDDSGLEKLARLLSVIDIFESTGNRNRPNNRNGELLAKRSEELEYFDSDFELEVIGLLQKWETERAIDKI